VNEPSALPLGRAHTAWCRADTAPRGTGAGYGWVRGRSRPA
jgi:hypothetical protein